MDHFTPKNNEWWIQATEGQVIEEILRGLQVLPAVHSTADTVERLFPVLSARGAGIDRRQHLYTRLMKGADKHFRGHYTRGEPVKGVFGQKRPFLWHAAKPVCWNCNGTGYAA